MMDFIRFKRGQQQIRYFRQVPHFDGNAFLPQYALIPLSFQTQMHSVPLVSAGDFVHEGQLIARADDNASVHIHASVPGIVSGIINAQLPNGHIFRGIHIRTGGPFEILGKQRNPYPWRQSDQTELLRFFNFSGLINTAGEFVPLAETVETAVKNGTKALTVMLYDKDPTCMLDSFLTHHFISEVAEGIAITAHAMGAAKIIIEACTQKKDHTLYDAVKAAVPNKEISYLAVPPVYPPENASIRSAEKTTAVIDAVTALAVYESVKYNQPMLTSYILLTGKTLDHSKVIKARIGTPIGHLIEECGGFKSKNTHIILNGLLRGTLVDSLDLPVGKGIKSIHAVGKEIDIRKQLEECIHCGQCLRSCPMFIDPINTVRHIRRKRYTDDILHSIAICRNCACCSAVCPAHIPLCTIIKSAAVTFSMKRGDGDDT